MPKIELDSTTQVVEAPENNFKQHRHQLFLAGGISNCLNWQNKMIDELVNYPELTIFNPRRKAFPMDDADAAEE